MLLVRTTKLFCRKKEKGETERKKKIKIKRETEGEGRKKGKKKGDRGKNCQMSLIILSQWVCCDIQKCVF